MRSMMYVLTEFEDRDLDWLAHAGHAEHVASGSAIVEAGRPLDAIFLVLSGRFSVCVREQQEREIARLGTGEIVGHMSLLDSLPPRTTVTALGEARVFVVPHAALQPKLAQDKGFAARFYRAIAIFLAHWVNHAVVQAGRGEAISLLEGVEEKDEISPDVLDAISLAGARFVEFLKRIGER